MTTGRHATKQIIGFALAWALGGWGLQIAAAQGIAGSNSQPGPREIVLQQQRVPYEVESVYWSLGKTNAPFLKEPELSPQGVSRGVLLFGTRDTNNAIALIWDRPKSKLYLDLNRNLDLTDDGAGVFTSTNKGLVHKQPLHWVLRFGSIV